MELSKEQYEQLPEFIKTDYQLIGDKYVSTDSQKVAALKTSLDSLDAKLKSRDSEFYALNEKMTAFEVAQTAKIEEAKSKALEEARSKGDVAAIEERYKQQMADLEKRVAEKTRSDVSAEFSANAAKEKAENVRKLFAKELAKDSKAEAALNMLLRDVIKPNELNEITLFNLDGSATSLKGDADMMAEIRKNEAFEYLIKDSLPTSGSGVVPGGSASTPTQGKLSATQDAAVKNNDSLGLLRAALTGN